MSKPSSAKKRKKDGESEEEESDLIQNSSEDEAEEEGELLSVSSTPPLKPFITDRWEWGGTRGQRLHGSNLDCYCLGHFLVGIYPLKTGSL